MSQTAVDFDRNSNVGLHHLALEVESETQLNALYEQLVAEPSVEIAFAPELMGEGPRKHMMCHEPSGIRVEFVWPGN